MLYSLRHLDDYKFAVKQINASRISQCPVKESAKIEMFGS